jgi:hypothetical protein
LRDVNPGFIRLVKANFIGRREMQIQRQRAGRICDQQRRPIYQIRGEFNRVVISGVAIEGELKLAAGSLSRHSEDLSLYHGKAGNQRQRDEQTLEPEFHEGMFSLALLDGIASNYCFLRLIHLKYN